MKILVAGYHLPRVHLPRVVIEGNGHDRDYDRDHEHDAVMGSVIERTKHHPKTWDAHIDKPGGLMSIVEMEYKELMTEKADGSHHGIEKELTDLAAACICALRKMKSM
ncbi:hypothetical protein H1N92_gp75 [Escherichia phage aaroes]|uniref:Uncharacterized protein n=1 Tax=Escherichia phage aaroes TaxID=2696376 RepID=A0A6B9WPL6_9CAUD|nr:hypothetical protein H1N92_gp75 [Escherichia phage aaroes]QHR65790.1 hypothetical protein aaroes_75 [Escherichia phage aaroes]